jgi:folate-binding protein YgfZ
MSNNDSTSIDDSSVATPGTLNPTLGAVCISGSDRLNFLQGQLTQDVANLKPGAPLLAGWANAKGRLLCVTWLFEWQEQVWLIMPAELCAGVARRLSMFVLRADARIAVSEHTLLPTERHSAKDLIKPEDINVSTCFYSDKYFYFEAASDAGLLLGRNNEAPDMADWRLTCIRAGLPLVWPTTAESFVPQMLNLDLLNGISFTKGCYVGQEIVARTQNLGKIKRRMYRFTSELANSCNPGDPVYSDGKQSGEVVDAVCTGSQNELLAVVRIETLRAVLSLDQAGKDILTRRKLPYEIPESL